jgi:hypothetical protein
VTGPGKAGLHSFPCSLATSLPLGLRRRGCDPPRASSPRRAVGSGGGLPRAPRRTAGGRNVGSPHLPCGSRATSGSGDAPPRRRPLHAIDGRARPPTPMRSEDRPLTRRRRAPRRCAARIAPSREEGDHLADAQQGSPPHAKKATTSPMRSKGDPPRREAGRGAGPPSSEDHTAKPCVAKRPSPTSLPPADHLADAQQGGPPPAARQAGEPDPRAARITRRSRV